MNLFVAGVSLNAGDKLFATVMTELRAHLMVSSVTVKYTPNCTVVNTPNKVQIRGVTLISSTYEIFSEYHNVMVDFGDEGGVEEFQVCIETGNDGNDQVVFRKVEPVL